MANSEQQRLTPIPRRASVVPGREVSTIRVLGIATQGGGTSDEAQLRTMLREFDAEIVPFDRHAKAGMLLEIVRKTRSRKYENRGSRGNWNRRRSCRHYRAGHTGHTVRG